ncbi:MAG: inactive transglutaminase family protein [Candidatus Anaerobiospirillum merdipullorum]|uniref:Inactive transglutaminase family protein n=1 Tax=Candidatus Anaerobiospirillum merdipullorum TaxID=2838450 RepID=A0A9E2KNG4_9GAMM|nr:inactive transglutaminase family protein [Candidatus Anaerobiospirillum merdipullorum]
MVSRGVFYIVTAILFVTGLLFMIYQHVTFEIPFFPGEQRQVWSVEAKVEFEPSDKAATVDLALPAIQPGFTQISQSTASVGFGAAYVLKQQNSYVEWTKRNPLGLQTLYYRAEFLRDDNAKSSSMTIPELKQNTEPEPYATAMREIADAAQLRSSNPFSFTVQVIDELKRQPETASFLLSQYRREDLIIHILELAQIPARIVGVLDLEDGRRNRALTSRIAVFDGTHYEIFDPSSGASGIRSNQLIWNNHDGSLLDVQGGTNARVSFSIIQNSVPAAQAGLMKVRAAEASGNEVVSLSIASLPLEEQSLFKGILLLPVGVIIVVFLRVLIGVKTSGTFMPVLIAMAFLQTSLMVGLIGFVSIVAIGLVVRSWLSHLNLLLVARISAVIITVIAIIGAISLITYKIGLTEGIKVTFFPMIILSWTIERMSILWEEEGYKEVLKQGGGSLFVAVCAFIAMDSLVIQHLTFNFLGLQLIILSLVLLMGNYTGFRLSELKRFKPLADNIKSERNGDETELEADRLQRERKELQKSQPAQRPRDYYRERRDQDRGDLDK